MGACSDTGLSSFGDGVDDDDSEEELSELYGSIMFRGPSGCVARVFWRSGVSVVNRRRPVLGAILTGGREVTTWWMWFE